MSRPSNHLAEVFEGFAGHGLCGFCDQEAETYLHPWGRDELCAACWDRLAEDEASMSMVADTSAFEARWRA